MTTRPVPRLPLRQGLRLLDLRDTPRWLAALCDVFDEYGEVVRVPVPGKTLLGVRDPGLITGILRGSDWDKRADVHKYHHMLMGEGLVTSQTNQAWRRRRRAVNPLFGAGALDAYLPKMATGFEQATAGWRSACEAGEEVDAHMGLRDATTRINFECFLHEDFEPWRDDIHEIMDVLAMPQSPIDLALPRWVPTATMRRHKDILARLDHIVASVVRLRREGDIDRGDYLSALLKAADTDPDAELDQDGLRDEIVTLLVAGHETTATGIGWTLYELAQRPELQDRIAQEASAHTRPWTVGSLEELELATRSIWEALRLYPPVMVFVPRQNKAATTLGDASVPAGCVAFLFPYAAMRHPDLYARPGEYDPDRYDDQSERDAHDHAWMPFARGPRKCAGEGFAMVEMALFLAEICTQYKFRRARDIQPLMVNGALMPEGGVPLILEAR